MAWTIYSDDGHFTGVEQGRVFRNQPCIDHLSSRNAQLRRWNSVAENKFSSNDTFCREITHWWLWNMRILLRSIKTGSYFQTVANWTDDANVAFDFEQVERAQKAALETGLAQAEVVLSYDNPRCELRLPIG